MLTTDKFHKKEARRIIPNDDTLMRRVLQLKYATWNIRGLGEMKKNNTKIQMKIILKFQ